MGVTISKKPQIESDHHHIFIKTSNQRVNKNHFVFETVLKHTSASGKFWKCTHKHSKKSLLIEEVPKLSVINGQKAKQLSNEMQILRSVQHPFIANLRYLFHDPMTLYVGMDYLGGGTLSYHLKKRPVLTEAEAKFNTACILSALEYLHSKDIVHGNITPDNLIFDSDGYIYLCDFKMATVLNGDQNEADLRYEDFQNDVDLSYSSPEFLLRKNIGKTIDYYSIGMIAYEMMVGHNPLKGKGKKEILTILNNQSIQVKKSELPEDWSFDAADFINRIIQRRTENRLGLFGFSQLKSHPWLKDFPWQKILDKTLEPPYKDFIRGGKAKGDLLYVNNNLGNRQVKQITEGERRLVENSQTLFAQFDYDYYHDAEKDDNKFLVETLNTKNER